MLQHYIEVPRQGGDVPEQYDRLIEGGRPYSFRVMSAVPQSRQAISTALNRDTALLTPPYIGGTPTAV